MKKKFFFVIYFNNEKIKEVLNGLRLIADSSQNNITHLTVKGPYVSRQIKRLDHDNKLIEGKFIDVLGAGNFFMDNQNTVFLQCKEKVELNQIWKTKDNKTYKSYHPHITIYDGDNEEYAKEIYKIINSYDLSFKFKVSKLEMYSTIDKYSLFNLKEIVNYNLISKLAGHKVTPENVKMLGKKDRLKIIEGLCKLLKDFLK